MHGKCLCMWNTTSLTMDYDESSVKCTWWEFLSQRHSASSEEGLFPLPVAVMLHLSFTRFHHWTILFLTWALKKWTKKKVKNEICRLKFRFSALQTQWWKKSKQICVLLFHLLWPMHVFPLLFVSLSLCPALWQANHNCLSNHSIISLLWLVVSLSSLVQFIQETQINMLCLTWSMSFYFCCHWEVQSNTLIMHDFRSWPMFKT